MEINWTSRACINEKYEKWQKKLVVGLCDSVQNCLPVNHQPLRSICRIAKNRDINHLFYFTSDSHARPIIPHVNTEH